MKQAILKLLALLLPVVAFAQPNCSSLRYQDSIYQEVKITNNIKFATATPYGLLAQPQDLYMDIYEPANDTQTRRPLIIFQFGGGFLIGTRNQPPIPQYCEYFAKCGYVVASIDYRIGFDVLSTGSAERAVVRAVQDQRAAVRHLCQRANIYGIDTASIFLTGTSAGCFAGLHSTFMVEAQIPASSHGIWSEPDDLGSIDSSGNNDYGNRSPRARGIINHWGAILDTALIDPNDSVPVLSIHGTVDMGVPYEYGYPFYYPVFPQVYGSKPIAERMTNLGLYNVLIPLEGLNHEPELINTWVNDTMTNAGRRFLWSIIKPVTSAIQPNDAWHCTGRQVTYYVQNTPGSKYCWSITGPAYIVQNNNSAITLAFTDTGNVTLSVLELNYMGAQGDIKTTSFYIRQQTIAGFTYTADELNVSFTNTSQYATDYVWMFGDTTTDMQNTNPSYTYAAPGTYTVTLVTDIGGCADEYEVDITIDTCPKANFTVDVTGNNVFFYASTTNTNSYQWNFGDGSTAAVAAYNVFHQYQQNGTYTVILSVSNALGCAASDTVEVHLLSTGMKESQPSFEIVYSNNLLAFDINEKAEVQIFDLAGALVHTQSVSTKTYISTAHLAKGSYIVKLQGKPETFRFVKQ